MHIEEKIFYPRLKKEAALKDITLEGIEEHHQSKMFIKEIPRLPEKNERFEPKLKVLMEDIRHHVKEEEREMFPKAQTILSIPEMDELGAEMEAEKKKFKKAQAAAAK
jgi:hemerythrin-like domain-containing protein